ncbi:MAG TPA: tRNA (adenosine(37)-N6)-threonylcarbamoyltransferase complex ATPase subunit type 1 TsaE [Luteimonas sp.]|nr:tRNA (adenosine(37)-N6)-threonylcarbamoyltransferase complex ATPase subunit type 1 TsaE [Luteimonas sp.]
MRLFLADAEATEMLGRALAATRPGDAVVHLHGDLGAGKSTLARAMLRGLGVEGAIRSPTYTLVERYPLADGREALHLDLYRIADAGELEFLGLDGADIGLWLIEWPERGVGALPQADLRVDLEVAQTGRNVSLVAETEIGGRWLEGLAFMAELRSIVAAS